MIDIKNVTFGYSPKSHPVFDGFSLRLEPGKVYGLLGPNGAGKSTLLYLMTGLLRTQRGKILVDGHDAAARRAETLADFYLVPEEFELPRMGLNEYIRTLRSFYPHFSDDILKQCLEEFELASDLNIRELSTGQKKKVFMAFALAANTRHLLMDEPTNGLDLNSKRQFRRVIAAHATEERTILISTHQVHDIEQLIDHILILVTANASPASVLCNATMSQLSENFAFTIAPSQLPEAIYAERTAQGYACITRRHPDDSETPVNLELLYNALQRNSISNP